MLACAFVLDPDLGIPRRGVDKLKHVGLPSKLDWHPPHGSCFQESALQVDYQVLVVKLAFANSNAFGKAWLKLATAAGYPTG